MNTRFTFFFRLALALMAAGSVAMVAVRQNEIAGLRAEQQTLLSGSQEAERLARGNPDMEKLRAESEEAARLRAANKDLPKLRNEVRRLRKQLEEMAKLRAENERLQSQPANDPNQRPQNGVVAANVFPREALRDVGLGLPVMTLQTFFAALNQGNVDRAMECLTPEAAAKLQAHTEQTPREQLLQVMDGFTGFQITDRSQPSPDEVVLTVALTGTGANPQLHFKQVGNEWKMAP